MTILVVMIVDIWVTNLTLLIRYLQIENVHVPFMNTSLVKREC